MRNVDRNGDQDETYDEDEIPTYRFVVRNIEELMCCVLPLDLFLAILETPLALRPCGETHIHLPKCQMATGDWLIYGSCLGEAVDVEVAKAQEAYENEGYNRDLDEDSEQACREEYRVIRLLIFIYYL